MQSSLEPFEATGETASLIPKKSDRFIKSAYKDVWATILWLVFLAGFAVLSFFSIKHLNQIDQPAGSLPIDGDENTGAGKGFSISVKHIAGILLTGAAGGFLLSFAYFIAMRRFVIIRLLEALSLMTF